MARAAEAARAEEVASLRAEVGEVLAQSEAAIRTAASQVRAPLCLPRIQSTMKLSIEERVRLAGRWKPRTSGQRGCGGA